MAEGKEPKKKKTAAASNAAAEVQRVQNLTSGEMLRVARTEKKLGLEEISSAIHIRVAQLRALEEGNIEALPGMTYALGFVRSYANYLKINSGEVVNKFKMEHGAMKPQMPELHIPSQMGENRMPDPMIIGITAVAAVVLLLLWTIFSGGDDEVKSVSSDIPPVPVAESSMMMPSNATPVIPLETTASAASAATTPEAVLPQPVTPEVAAASIPAATPVIPLEPATAVQTPVMVPLPRPPVQAKQEAPVTPEVKPEENIPPPEDEIVIKRSNSRIVIKATESSWIQVANARKQIIAKKVLKPGEQFFVPQEEGMSLITTNAGGIDIYVDGVKSSPLGKSGEIVRGMPLDAERLTRKRTRVNQY